MGLVTASGPAWKGLRRSVGFDKRGWLADYCGMTTISFAHIVICKGCLLIG